MSELIVRPATAGDFPAVLQIYNHYVERSPVSFDVTPFTLQARSAWFDQFRGTGRYRLLVAEEREQLLAYAATHRFRGKPAYDTSVEASVYCAANATGRGLGTRLYTELFDALRGEDVHRAYAGVTLPNPASLALHARFGFEAVGTFREVGRKFGRYWDVIWLEKPLG